MFSSAAAALSQMFDRKFSGVLFMGIASTIALFVGLMFGMQWVVQNVPDFGLSWVHEVYKIISISRLTITFIVLAVPVAHVVSASRLFANVQLWNDGAIEADLSSLEFLEAAAPPFDPAALGC